VINDNAWHHLAFTVDDSGGKLYVDGVLKQSLPWTGTAGAPTCATALAFGRYPGGTTPHVSGQIDEVQIWNLAKTSNEVAAAMYRRPSGTELGLVACFPFDENAGNATADIGLNHFVGALNNGAAWGTRNAV
jgi:hypothetical protein